MKKWPETLVNIVLGAVVFAALTRNKLIAATQSTLSLCERFAGVLFFSGVFIGGLVLTTWSAHSIDSSSQPNSTYLIGVAMMASSLLRLIAWMLTGSRGPKVQH